jgi:uncharacterized protein (DUF2062 family)
MEYLTGSFFLGSEVAPVELTLEWFSENIDDIFVPLYVGTIFYSVFGSLFAYFTVNYLWKLSVNKEKKQRKDKNKLS